MYLIEQDEYSMLIGSFTGNANEIEEALNGHCPDAEIRAWIYEGDRLRLQYNWGYRVDIQALLGIK